MNLRPRLPIRFVRRSVLRTHWPNASSRDLWLLAQFFSALPLSKGLSNENP